MKEKWTAQIHMMKKEMNGSDSQMFPFGFPDESLDTGIGFSLEPTLCIRGHIGLLSIFWKKKKKPKVSFFQTKIQIATQEGVNMSHNKNAE